MAFKNNIELKHDVTYDANQEDDVYIDIQNIDAAMAEITKDFKNISKVAQDIKTTFKTLANHQSTKGKWKDMIDTCVKASNKVQNTMENANDKLYKRYSKSITAMVQKYDTDALSQAASEMDSLVE